MTLKGATSSCSVRLEIDPYYDWTYALIADYLARFASNEPDITPEKRQEILQQSIAYYAQALDRTDPANTQSRYSYLDFLWRVARAIGVSG